MTRNLALWGAVVLLAGACAKGSLSQANFTAADLYAAGLTNSEVTALLGSNWWPEAPTFAVPPLDAALTPAELRFAIVQRFGHIGTDERLNIRYSAYDRSSSAVARITSLESQLGTSLTGPPIGDQRDYYAQQMTQGAAPYESVAFVRVGSVNMTITYLRKDRVATPAETAKIGSKAVAHVKDLLAGKLKSKSLPKNELDLLPPPGPQLTLLGETELDVEAYPSLFSVSDPNGAISVLMESGVSRMLFATYALDRDSHMEVRAVLLHFDGSDTAQEWLTANVGADEATNGPIVAHYIDAIGETWAFFAESSYGAVLMCRSTIEGEASSRSCDDPLPRAAMAWKNALPAA